MEKVCDVCGAWFDCITSRTVCDDDCAASRLKTRQTSISARYTALKRILEEERVYSKDDKLARSERFFEGLLSWGCLYCGISLLNFSGICLDRISSKKRHTFDNVAPCCPLCNRVKSAEGETGFTFEEMGQIVGPAIARVRQLRAG
jgi:hypothetical protein